MRLGALRAVQRHLAYASPVTVLAWGLLYSWSADFSTKVLTAYGALLFCAATLGWCLWKRSRGQETAGPGARLEVDPTESPDDPVGAVSASDVLLVVAGVLVSVLAAIPPGMR